MNFTDYLISIISKYYCRPYKDSNIGSVVHRKIDGVPYTVYRYNHGLLFGIRQAFLAKSIIYLLLCCRSCNNNFLNWLFHNSKNDKRFIHKVMFASAFQRTGRESEVPSSQNEKLYLEYEKDDAKYFEYEARRSNLFNDHNEIGMYKQAIIWNSKCDDIRTSYLKNILHSAHLLDLRRMPFFDTKRIKKEVEETLFGSLIFSKDGVPNKQEIVDKLFDISGLLLDASGDRDVLISKRHLSERFFVLSNNHRQLGFVMNYIFDDVFAR